jgi:hypothetical protein
MVEVSKPSINTLRLYTSDYPIEINFKNSTKTFNKV